MFLELSFDSRAGDKEVSASKMASSWRYDRQDKQEMSLDELISDFQQITTSRQSKSSSGSDTSKLQLKSPPRHSKTKESDAKSRSFADRTRTAKQREVSKKKSTAAKRNVRDDDSSDDDDGAVMPMPRLEQVLRNKPSFALKRRAPTLSSTSTRPKQSLLRRPTPRVRSPVLPSPSLTPQSLSPVTSASVASSPLSMSEDLPTPDKPEEDSIDALIGKDIRDLNKLISSKGRQPRDKKTIGAANSPSSDEISSVLRQSTRFRKAESKDSRLRLKVPNGKPSLATLESPPPPPPPEEEEEDNSEDEEDSFAEEIRKLRESRRLQALPTKPPQSETLSEETKLESTEVCTTAALKVRNASNAINELLLQALKPFEDRQREEEKAKALEEENTSGDAVLRNAATAELQSATQTIVSQLDLTFADMTERRKADLKTEEDAVAAAKEAEKKEVEAAQAKKKADEKETKEREMEILRLIPMQGKLLTCSADIEDVLTQLDSTEAEVPSQPLGSASGMEAEIKALRSYTQRKIQEIEAQMTTEGKSDRSDGISWRAMDWMQDNFDVNQANRADKSNNQLSEKAERVETQSETTDDEGAYQDILQRQVLEKLDLTMLKLKHVLSIETKEAAEAQEKQHRENEEQKKRQTQQQLEDERGRREAEAAENARRRVMGLTSVDEVEGWIEEGRQLQYEIDHDRSLNRLIASLNDNMNAEMAENSSAYWSAMPITPNQEDALYNFARLETTMTAQRPAQRMSEEATEQQDIGHSSWQAPRAASRARPMQTHAWDELSGSLSSSDEEISSDSGPDDKTRLARRRQNHDSTGQRNWSHRFPSPSPLPSPSQQTRHASQRRKQHSQRVDDQVDRKNNLKVRYCGSYSPELKQRRRRRGVGELKPEVERMIHALQAERRQKTWWIQSHARSPVGRHRAIN